MNLVSSSNRLYRDKTSEIDEKYTISRDRIYLYFHKADCEMLVNDELFKGNVRNIEAVAYELEKALAEKQDLMSDKNKKIPYKTNVYTNNIIRACFLFKITEENSELIYAKAGKHTKGQLFKVVMKDRPFILLNSQPLACNNIEDFPAEGAYKIKGVLDFNCKISGLDLHQLGQTIGRNIEKMEGNLVRECRKKDPNFYLPRLFSFNNMKKAQFEGQVVRNYNLLQCANMAGLLQLDPEQTFKIIPFVISFDIKSAYMSVLINKPIFPGDLTVIDIDPHEVKTDYTGRKTRSTPYSVAADICKRLQRFETSSKWYYLAIDPNYHGDNEAVKYFLKCMKPFRRNFSIHPETKLSYVNQDQMVCFLEWDKKFYDEYYSIYMELTFEELLYNLLLICPDAKVYLMYSKSASDYLPKPIRDSKMQLYKIKEEQESSSTKNTSKMYTEQTYGKGLQLRDFKEDSEVMKSVCNETINIAMSLTCCSYTRYRLIHDWQGFTPLYLDSDSIKFQFGPEANNLAALVERQEYLNEINQYETALAGYPESNLGSWNVDGLYNRMMFIKKKCYIGYKDDGSTEVKLAGCDKEAYTRYFQNATLSTLQEIEAAQKLVIPHGKKKPFMTPDNAYADYTYEDVIYLKGAP